MSSSYLPLFGDKNGGGDVETGNALYPGISSTENMLRLGFIRKVFGIVTAQLILTAIIAASLMVNPGTQHMLAKPGIQIGLMLVSILGLIPLHMYKDKHPTNLFILAGWTAAFSVTVGLACTFYAPAIVIQAVFITGGVVGALTVYTFWATRRGVEFTWMAPMLYSALWAMIIWGFIQLFFRPGPLAQTIYSLLGALLFCGYIVFDVHLLATRLDVDDYVWGSVALYLDVINLFMYIMRILGQNQNNG